MQHTTLNFPEITLQQRDAHKLRGYFANKFGEESDLLHNHDSTGNPIYRYPKIQYKVVDNNPMVVGIDEGAKLLVKNFLRIKELDINGKQYRLQQKNLKSDQTTVGVQDDLFEYQWVTPWMALNSENYKVYQTLEPQEQTAKLKRILATNILNFFKAVKHHEHERIMVKLKLEETSTKFKNQRMTVFKGSFVSNVLLPDYIGIGKSVARGFGTIKLND